LAGYSRLLNYRRGLRFIRLLLEVEPTNRWEAELNRKISVKTYALLRDEVISDAPAAIVETSINLEA
jgi:hypothetical protein